MEKCPLSPHQADLTPLEKTDGVRVNCEACGRYTITDEARYELEGTNSRAAGSEYVLSGIARRESDAGRRITISTENVGDLLASVVPPRDPHEVLDRVLLFIGAKADSFLTMVDVIPETDYPIAFARNAQELAYCIQIGKDSGHIKRLGNQMRLTDKGWHRFNQLRDIQKDSSQAFVAMWFDSTLESIWKDGLKPALDAVGYRALRIDEKQFNDKIDDQIIAEIRRSGLLIADVTGHRGGVYFEAGFALRLGLHVIWTCRKDDLENAHFDTRQYNHIDWEDADDLKRRLINRIEATGLAKPRPTSNSSGSLNA